MWIILSSKRTVFDIPINPITENKSHATWRNLQTTTVANDNYLMFMDEVMY